ncbi:MAG: hypothetical protein K0Q94_4801 [Paenibacillus sp.]|nr:hypothetical protein [Paenibacillus sp.]
MVHEKIDLFNRSYHKQLQIIYSPKEKKWWVVVMSKVLVIYDIKFLSTDRSCAIGAFLILAAALVGIADMCANSKPVRQ